MISAARVLLVAGVCGVYAPLAAAQQGSPDPRDRAAESPLRNTPAPAATTVVGRSFRPERRDATDERIRGIELPAGFEISVFARDLGGPRMIEVADDGTVYVTRPDSGDVLLLRDIDADGLADERRVAIGGIPNVHGIALHQGTAFLAVVSEVLTADVDDDGGFGEPRVLVDTLPSGGQHPNRTLRVGPDGMLYVTVGSQTNAVPAPDTLDATMLRSELDGSDLRIHAHRLRNTLGFDWHPDTGELWAMDHGIDWLGDRVQREELNLVVEGENYGWPHCYEDARPNPTQGAPEGYDTLEEYCRTTRPMALGYTAHAAPMAMAFYDGSMFPDEYRGDAFVAMRGSWNRYPAVGYEVVRVRFEDGRPTGIEPFATGWLVDGGRAHFGRLAGIVVTPDGDLLVSDDTNGVIYRISYRGP